MRKKTSILLLGLAASVLFTACASTKQPENDTTPTVEATATLAPTPEATPEPTEAPQPTLAPTATPLPTATPTPRPDISGVSLKEIYKDYFMIGTIYNPWQVTGKDKDLILQHFNVMTPENLMKPDAMQPSEGNFRWNDADAMVEFCQSNGITPIGHTLCWHNQSGNYLSQVSDRESAIERLKTHVQTLAARYDGKIYSWDVLNEAIKDGAKLPANGDWKSQLRETQWTKSIGTDYIELLFTFAAEAAPNTLLYYNDYNMNDYNKAEVAAAMIKDLRSKGIRIDGIGMQGHYSTDTSLSSVRKSLELFSQIEGLRISVTELDVGVNGSNGKLSSANEKKQALYYAKLFSLYKEYADSIERVTFWGYRDDTSWRKESCPLIFNKDLSPKEAFYALMDPEAYVANAANDTQAAPVRQAKAAQGTPEIDGKKDSMWVTATSSYTINTPLYAWQGATGKAFTLYDDNYFYVLVEVEDSVLNSDNPNSYEQDSVEVFFDPENMKEEYYTDLCGQYRVNYKGELTFGTVPTTEGVKAAAATTNKGYIIELAIPLKSKPSSGAVFGFDVQINDANASGSRVSVMKFNDPTDNSYANASQWGEVVLK